MALVGMPTLRPCLSADETCCSSRPCRRYCFAMGPITVKTIRVRDLGSYHTDFGLAIQVDGDLKEWYGAARTSIRLHDTACLPTIQHDSAPCSVHTAAEKRCKPAETTVTASTEIPETSWELRARAVTKHAARREDHLE